MRTQDEILARARDKDTMDMLGFGMDVYLDYLPWEHAKSFLKEDCHAKFEDKWDSECLKELTRENVLAAMADYMTFAIGKAEDHRGISASRSVIKMGAWAWILGDEELLKKIADTEYAQYGMPILKVICEHLGFPFPDEEWAQNMAAGRPCSPDCYEGCEE